MARAAGLVLAALVESGDVIKKADKTGRVWFSLANPEEQVADANTTRRKKKPGQLPADWTVSDELRQWARGAGCDDGLIAAYEAYFKDWARGGEKVYADWDATFRNAVRGDWGDVRKKYKPGAVAGLAGVVW